MKILFSVILHSKACFTSLSLLRSISGIVDWTESLLYVSIIAEEYYCDIVDWTEGLLYVSITVEEYYCGIVDWTEGLLYVSITVEEY